MHESHPEIQLQDVAIQDADVSSAVDEPVRAMILDMLADDEMTIEDIHAELERRGEEKAVTTVRHHVNELRDAGLLDVARLEERRGGTTKYYRATAIVLSYALPAGAEDAVDAMAEDVAPVVGDVVAELRATHGDELDRIAGEMAPCAHCATQKYETYLLLTVLRRAFVRAYAREAVTGSSA